MAADHDLVLVEDACQAHGAARAGRRAGAAGAFGAFSFYPAKNLGAFGDAGALVTDDDDLADRVRSLREHGQRRKYEHEYVGYTARLDTIQAARAPAQADRSGALERGAASRGTLLRRAPRRQSAIWRCRPLPSDSEPVWHLYVVRTPTPRPRSRRSSSERGIATGRHYPEPLHLAPRTARSATRRGDFPVAERLARRGPLAAALPGITEEQLEAVVDAIRDYFRSG